jgi:hypothetical protein
MKITLTTNIGSDDLRRFGVLEGGDPAALRKSLDDYSRGKTVDAPEHLGEYLLKQGLGTVGVQGVAQSASIHGTPADATVTAASPVQDSSASDAIRDIGTMRSKDKLQEIIDRDQRSTVVDAATKRLKELA